MIWERNEKLKIELSIGVFILSSTICLNEAELVKLYFLLIEQWEDIFTWSTRGGEEISVTANQNNIPRREMLPTLQPSHPLNNWSAAEGNLSRGQGENLAYHIAKL